jgi:hypothetical protein
MNNAGCKDLNVLKEYHIRAVLVLFFLVGVVQNMKLKKKKKMEVI